MITTKLTLLPLNPQEIQQMQLDLDYSNLKLLIIDEFGTCDPTKLAVIDLRLKQIYNNDRLFGGLHCLLVGDLWQLPAISGCFASAMLEYERFLQLQKKHQNNSLPPKEMTQYHKWRKGKFHIQSLWRKGCSILAVDDHNIIRSDCRTNLPRGCTPPTTDNTMPVQGDYYLTSC